jgi:gliding motility-associated protein GldM
MALPKEPRQKMINIMYLVLTALLALNVSAEILNAFKVVDNSLKESNNVLNSSTAAIYANFEELLKDPKSSEKAGIWKPKAEQVQQLASTLFKELEDYKQALKVESDLDPATGAFKEDNIDAATRYFDTKGNGKILYAKLEDFKKKLLAIDADMTAEIGNKLPLNLEIPKSAAGNISTGDKTKDWINSYFHMTPTIAAVTILSKFQNDVKNSENLAATYCINQVGAVKLVMDKFEPMVGTSSTYLMPGEEMTVVAGLGAFNSNVKPVVTIDGKSIAVNANGVAESKFNVGSTGTKSMNVSVSFVDPNTGENKTISKKIDYVVGAPSGVAVSADKMNVLYVGVDNPLTITAGAGAERVTADFTGGEIKKIKGSQFITIPSKTALGMQNVIVKVDGKVIGKVPYRVKLLPDPTPSVAGVATKTVSTGTFMTSPGVRAMLENVEFDAPYVVKSFTVGANIPGNPNFLNKANTGNVWNEAQSIISGLKPGSRVYIEDIVVRGPDGIDRKLPTSLVYNLR